MACSHCDIISCYWSKLVKRLMCVKSTASLLQTKNKGEKDVRKHAVIETKAEKHKIIKKHQFVYFRP